MPTKREREYYAMGVRDGLRIQSDPYGDRGLSPIGDVSGMSTKEFTRKGLGRRSKRKLSGWQKFIKANSKKKIYKYRDGKLNLKKMGVAYRKTREYKKNQKKRR
jgi:hypothetical protein